MISYKKIISIILVCIMLLCFSFCAFANDIKPTKVKVGYCENYGTISIDNSKNFSGYGYEYLTKVANCNNWEYEFVLGSWNENIERLKNGEIDIFGPLQKNNSREKIYTFPDYAFGEEFGALYTNINSNYYFEDFEDFNKMKIATVKDSFYHNEFETYSKKNGFNPTYIYKDNAVELIDAIKNGEADAFISGSIINAKGTKIIAKFSVNPFYFATSKGNTEIIDGINNAMGIIKEEDITYNYKLFNKYYGNSVLTNPIFSKNEIEYIKKNPVIKVAYNKNLYPIEFYNKKTNKYEGISADIFDEIEKISGMKFEYVGIENSDELSEITKNKSVNIVSLGLGVLDNTLGSVLSDPYVEIPAVFVANKNVNLYKDLSICISNNNKNIKKYIQNLYPSANIITCDDTKQCLESVLSGKDKATIVNPYLYDEIISKMDDKVNFGVKKIDIKIPILIEIVDKNDTLLKSIITTSINKITDKDINNILLTNSINNKYENSFNEVFGQYSRHVISIIIFALMFILIYVMHNREKLKRIAFEDELTGIYNDKKFLLEVNNILKNYMNNEYCMVYFDVEKFKYINKVFGYDVGDEVLRTIANTLQDNIKPPEHFARLFNDNFAFIIINKQHNQVVKRINNLLEEIMKNVWAKYDFIKIDLCCGVYNINEDDKDASDIIDKANIAHKAIKGIHEKKINYYDITLKQNIIREKEIEDSMQGAIDNNEFKVYLQPKYRLDNNKLYGAEALVRWARNEKIISPQEFIPLFERNGFVVKLDKYMLTNVCKLISDWIASDIEPVPISVNLSRIHIGNNNIVEELTQIVDDNNVPREYIEFEVTETTIYGNIEHIMNLMNDLRCKGFKVSMDDFGSGYSSLNLLHEVPVDTLKLDRGFLCECDDDKKGKTIVKAIVTMAKELNLTVLSEGVETKQQAEFLNSIGCDLVQGFYFARPMEINKFEETCLNIVVI